MFSVLLMSALAPLRSNVWLVMFSELLRLLFLLNYFALPVFLNFPSTTPLAIHHLHSPSRLAPSTRMSILPLTRPPSNTYRTDTTIIMASNSSGKPDACEMFWIGLLVFMTVPIVLCIALLAWHGLFAIAGKGWAVFDDSGARQTAAHCSLPPQVAEALPQLIEALPQASILLEALQEFVNRTT